MYYYYLSLIISISVSFISRSENPLKGSRGSLISSVPLDSDSDDLNEYDNTDNMYFNNEGVPQGNTATMRSQRGW